MYKRVRYFIDYLIEAETDEEALEKGNKALDEDMNNGWFSLDYKIMNEEDQVIPSLFWRAGHDPAGRFFRPNLPL